VFICAQQHQRGTFGKYCQTRCAAPLLRRDRIDPAARGRLVPFKVVVELQDDQRLLYGVQTRPLPRKISIYRNFSEPTAPRPTTLYMLTGPKPLNFGSKATEYKRQALSSPVSEGEHTTSGYRYHCVDALQLDQARFRVWFMAEG